MKRATTPQPDRIENREASCRRSLISDRYVQADRPIVMLDFFDRSDDVWREIVGRIGRGERIRGRAL